MEEPNAILISETENDEDISNPKGGFAKIRFGKRLCLVAGVIAMIMCAVNITWYFVAAFFCAFACAWLAARLKRSVLGFFVLGLFFTYITTFVMFFLKEKVIRDNGTGKGEYEQSENLRVGSIKKQKKRSFLDKLEDKLQNRIKGRVRCPECRSSIFPVNNGDTRAMCPSCDYILKGREIVSRPIRQIIFGVLECIIGYSIILADPEAESPFAILGLIFFQGLFFIIKGGIYTWRVLKKNQYY